MPQSYTVYQGQTLGEGEAVERVHTPRGGIEIVIQAHEAATVWAGRQIMERHHSTLAALENDTKALPE